MICETPYGFLSPALSSDQASETKQEAEDIPEDIFTFSSKPRLAPHGKPLNLSSEGCSFSVDLKEEISGVWRGAQMEDDFYGSDSNEEVSYFLSNKLLLPLFLYILCIKIIMPCLSRKIAGSSVTD